MKFKTTLFFIFLFAGVLSLYLFQNKHETARVDQAKKNSDDFKVQFEGKPAKLERDQEIIGIEVRQGSEDKNFRLEKQNSVWRLIDPVQSLADQAIAQGMVGMIKMALGQKLLRPEGNWAEYGLDQPEITVGVKTKSDPSPHFLSFGKEAPLGGGVFARWDDKKAYFVLPGALKSSFRRTVYEMREKRVFLTPLPKMDRVYIEIGEQTLDWTLKNGVWYWMEPIDLIGKKVAQDQMTAVLQTLAKLYIKEFVDGSDIDARATEISMISDRIQIHAGENEEAVYFGKEEPLKTAYYVHRENDKITFLVDQTKVIEILDLLGAIYKVNHAPPGAGTAPQKAA